MSLTPDKAAKRNKAWGESLKIVVQLAYDKGYRMRDGESVYDMVIRYCKDKRDDN